MIQNSLFDEEPTRVLKFLANGRIHKHYLFNEKGDKWCGQCREYKPLSGFPRRSKGRNGAYTVCRECCAVNRDPAKERERILLRKYGLTIADYERMKTEQNGLCAICGEPPRTGFRGKKDIGQLVIDHCHVTGKVRALLCHNCNVILGHLERRSYLSFDAFHGYLKRHKPSGNVHHRPTNLSLFGGVA